MPDDHDQKTVAVMASALSQSPLLSVIEYAVRDARDKGLDECSQYRMAIAAVRRVEPDLSVHAASRLVNMLLEQLDPYVCAETRRLADSDIAEPVLRAPLPVRPS